MTLAQLSKQFDVNAITTSKWKAEALEHFANVFRGAQSKDVFASSVETDMLYAQIGQLKVENNFLKKKCAEIGDKRHRVEVINPEHKQLSVRKQCEILAVPMSSLYYQPIPEKRENIKMMNLMDKHLQEHPTEGVISMVDLLKEKG